MMDSMNEYVDRALSRHDNKPSEDYPSAPYKVVIEMSEGEDGFWMEASIPFQTDSVWGATLRECVYTRQEAIDYLRKLIEKLDA